MNTVEKKRASRRPVSRWLVLAVSVIVLAGTGVCWWMLEHQTVQTTPESAVTYGELLAYQSDEVRSLTVTQPGKAPWTLLQDEDGQCTLAENESWPLDSALVQSLLSAASVVSYEKILTEDPADYADHPEDFGLAEPQLTVSVIYADGASAVMHMGTPIQGIDMSYVYMLIDGDDRLFALDKGTFEVLNIDVSLLHAVTQPTIHKARIDRITFTGADGQITAEWELQGAITDTDAAAQWMMTTPYQYPADVDALDSLRQNLSSLRLGAFVCEATPENLAAYGLSSPRFTITVHQAEGMINSINDAGEVEYVSWPESVFTLTVGSEKNSNVDYVLADGSIYTASHFTLDTYMSLSALDTLSRYPVNIAAATLYEMTVTANGVTDVYSITRESETTGEETETVTLNGQAIPYDAFEAAYIRLLTVRISGLLPDGWTPAEKPHTRFSFTTESGLTQTVELATFDALHDAVLVDGHAVFYLIKNGLEFTLDAGE